MGALDKLIIPTSSRLHGKKPVRRCVVPTPDGPCGHPFFEGEELREQQHVANCAKRHHDFLMEQRNIKHPEIMRAWDPELEKWVTQNKEAILRGDTTI